ncbi:MAG: O-antigen ligase family protein, partial [Patescibacteria group bacterium]
MKKQKKQKEKRWNKQSFSNWFIVIFIFLLPTQFGKHFFLPFSYLGGVRVDYLAPTLHITDILVFVIALLNFRSIISFLKNRSFLVFLIFVFFNIGFAIEPWIASYRWLKILELISIFIVFIKTPLKWNLIWKSFFVSTLFQFVLTVLQMVQKHSIQGVYYYFGERYLSLSTPDIAKASFDGVELLRPYATFSHPNSMAGYFLLLYAFISFQKYHNNILQKVFEFILTLLIFFSFSKIAIGMYFIILITRFFVSKEYRKCIPCTLSAIIVPLALGFVFIRAQTDPMTISKRIVLIHNSVFVIRNSPLLGTGLGNYLYAQNNIPQKFFLLFTQPVHNIFILLVAELGVVASFVLAIIFITYVLKHKQSSTFYVLCSVILVTGFFDHYWL